jgi:rhodanese-related sulfurtransferase
MTRRTATGSRPFPAALWQAVLIIFVGSVIGLAYNGVRRDGIPLVGSVRVVKFGKPALGTAAAASTGGDVAPAAAGGADPRAEEGVPSTTAPEAVKPVAEESRPAMVETVLAEEPDRGGSDGVEVFSPLPVDEPAEQGEDDDGPLALDLAQALELFEGGRAVFVDARMPDEFAAGHISGAFNLPLDDLESHLEVLNYLPEDGLLITYCDGSECELSLELADELTAMGFGEVRVFFGGWERWIEAGYPTETGEVRLPY